MIDDAARTLKAVAPVRFDNSGANPGDLWLNDYGDGGRYIGNIDDPLYADLIVAAVNALPTLLAVAEVRAWCMRRWTTAGCATTRGHSRNIRHAHVCASSWRILSSLKA